jgi:6-pyruvoyltetrahydropterin/6-carboxytetrahydropterin synthase
MYAVRKVEFCAGHRVLNHESKCANAHGHNYLAEIYAYQKDDELDCIGRVIDFSEIKKKVKNWIDDNWDHTFIIYEKDCELLAIQDALSVNKPVFIAPFNPTAENMAWYLLNVVCIELFCDTGVEVRKIVLHETPNCRVEARNDH